MRGESTAEIEKRRAAIRGAGGLTVSLALGNRGSARLLRSSKTPKGESRWIGSFEGGGEITPAIGIAGLVAEWDMDHPGNAAGQLAALIYDEIITPPMGLRHVVLHYSGLVDAIVDVRGLLTDHRSFFDWAVAELLEKETIPDAVAWDRFHSLC